MGWELRRLLGLTSQARAINALEVREYITRFPQGHEGGRHVIGAAAGCMGPTIIVCFAWQPRFSTRNFRHPGISRAKPK